MKTCPQCGAKTFDDLFTCYGCLYVFPRKERADVVRFNPPARQVQMRDNESPMHEIPAETFTEVPAKTPMGAPRETPAEAPTETPTEVPAEAPTETLAETSAPAQPIRLEVTFAAGERRIVSFSKNDVLIGRGSDCDLVLEDKHISRSHLRIVRDADGRLWAEDMQATNPTLCNGMPLLGKIALNRAVVLDVQGVMIKSA